MEHQEAKEVEDTQETPLNPVGESLEGSIPSPLNQGQPTPSVDTDEMLLSEHLVVAEKLADESHVITGSASVDSSVPGKRHSHQSTQSSVQKIQIIYSFVTRSVYKDVDVERIAGILDRLGCAPVSLNMKRKIVAQGSRSLSGYGFAIFRSLQDALRAVGGLSKLVDDGITYDAQLATCTRKLYSKALQALAAEDQSSDVHDVHNCDVERASPTTSASPKPASSTSGSRTPRDDDATPPQALPALQGAFAGSIHHQSPAVPALPMAPPYPHYFVAHPPASVVSPSYPASFPVHQPAMLPQAPLAPAEWARHAFQEFGVPNPMEVAMQQHQLSLLYAEQVHQHQLIGHPHQQRRDLQYHVPQVPHIPQIPQIPQVLQDGTYGYGFGAQHPLNVQYAAPAGGLPPSSHNPHHAMGFIYQPHRQPQHFNAANHPLFYPAHPYAAPVAHVPRLMHPTLLPHNGMPSTPHQHQISMAATQQHNRRAHYPPRSHQGTVNQPHPPSDQLQSNQSL
eukprot:gene24611-29735_t